ncbi:MAG: FKBP-type peptidyl-prolyl cis-trans isomerase [Alloprevotella sp.]|nr:FKBP-type peptidyl-prolyl cis-trans isomerase [Prevotellamassilia sp.]MCI6144641.1 FKBP-type peptidyl-prolyl cis-trans isomerase [Bacteroidales bacterium]MDY2624138.1 FKBP-type peptidyl-prolyl cis-trans isomerase [Alloprevotella sp.]MDD7563181.1 FKBP-type peptidyl-prolyl cis-trans isomerase [Prevotellamassilia sp.]MDY2778882.1 FKBP-type peptidyl-prolyl cis-trans isomerase [Alloprevotella sp.]
MDKLSYALGIVIGHNLKGLNIETINSADFAEAVQAVISGQKPAMADAEAQQIVNQFVTEQQEAQSRAARAEGEAFLKENAGKEGVVVLPSGLQYTVLREGQGRQPKASDSVKCHYEGTLTNGTVFDSSYRRGEPATFPLGGVIAGWTEGLQLMKEGAKFRFFIPYNLAYGERGAGQSIPPYAALIFDVELLEVV